MKNNLKRIREMRNLEQADVARELGISLSTYRSWEQGSRGLNGEKLIMFANYFDVSTDALLGTQFSELKESTELTASESELLESFRALNYEGKSIARAVLSALVRSGTYKDEEEK